jgi:hypothetical protein
MYDNNNPMLYMDPSGNCGEFGHFDFWNCDNSGYPLGGGPFDCGMTCEGFPPGDINNVWFATIAFDDQQGPRGLEVFDNPKPHPTDLNHYIRNCYGAAVIMGLAYCESTAYTGARSQEVDFLVGIGVEFGATAGRLSWPPTPDNEQMQAFLDEPTTSLSVGLGLVSFGAAGGFQPPNTAFEESINLFDPFDAKLGELVSASIWTNPLPRLTLSPPDY